MDLVTIQASGQDSYYFSSHLQWVWGVTPYPAACEEKATLLGLALGRWEAGFAAGTCLVPWFLSLSRWCYWHVTVWDVWGELTGNPKYNNCMEVYCSGSRRNYKALHSAGWGTSTAGPVVIPGYVKLVMKSLCQAPLLSCWDVLIKKKWEDRLAQLLLVWFFPWKQGKLNQGLLKSVFVGTHLMVSDDIALLYNDLAPWVP